MRLDEKQLAALAAEGRGVASSHHKEGASDRHRDGERDRQARLGTLLER
jgi:hypothetical protein